MLRIDVITIVLIILLLMSFLGRCVLDWIELRDEWWEMIEEEKVEDDEETG